MEKNTKTTGGELSKLTEKQLELLASKDSETMRIVCAICNSMIDQNNKSAGTDSPSLNALDIGLQMRQSQRIGESKTLRFITNLSANAGKRLEMNRIAKEKLEEKKD